MKTDLYTKIVLTIIAIVLTLNLVKDFDWITSAKADGVIDVNVVSIEGQSLRYSKLPVSIENISLGGSSNSTLPVNIRDSKTLDVKVTNY